MIAMHEIKSLPKVSTRIEVWRPKPVTLWRKCFERAHRVGARVKAESVKPSSCFIVPLSNGQSLIVLGFLLALALEKLTK